MHNYIYYHCTKNEKILIVPNLVFVKKNWIASYHPKFKKVSLPKDWAEELLKMAEKDFNNSAPSLTASVKESETKLSVISQKLERLLIGYLDQVIDQADYCLQKSKLFCKRSRSKKKSLIFHTSRMIGSNR